MAQYGEQLRIAMEAGADLSAAQNHLVRQSAANTVLLVGSAGATNGLGVLIDKPQSGEQGAVAMVGMAKVVAGSSMAVGAPFTASASGRAVTAAPASGQAVFVYGTVMEASSFDGDVVTVWLTHPWRFVAIA